MGLPNTGLGMDAGSLPSKLYRLLHSMQCGNLLLP